LTYEEYVFEKSYTLKIFPSDETDIENEYAALEMMVNDAQAEDKESEIFYLPGTFKGRNILWSEDNSDNSKMIFLLMVALAFATFVISDMDLESKVKKRNEEMVRDYPAFVSKLVLYFGAGLSLRSIIEAIAKKSKKKESAGKKLSFLDYEIIRMDNELKGGISEQLVYESLGVRCHSKEYTALSMLLSQNLRKGNGILLSLLREESDKAFDERIKKAREYGEKAGTKMLIPMIMLLVIVFVLIMVPAFMGMGF